MDEEFQSVLGRLLLLLFDATFQARGVGIRRFISDGKNLCKTFFLVAIGIPPTDVDLATY
jgi:hypothetical protein